nr:hypothetical protein [Desulfobulbaceae bacterium]
MIIPDKISINAVLLNLIDKLTEFKGRCKADLKCLTSNVPPVPAAAMVLEAL